MAFASASSPSATREAAANAKTRAARRSGELVEGIGGEVGRYQVVPDEREVIAETLRRWCDARVIDVSSRRAAQGWRRGDVTPEATLDVGERMAPGIAEAMRAEGMTSYTQGDAQPFGGGGARGDLDCELPGSEKSVRESLEAVIDVLPHAVDLLRGVTEHPKGNA